MSNDTLLVVRGAGGMCGAEAQNLAGRRADPGQMAGEERVS